MGLFSQQLALLLIAAGSTTRSGGADLALKTETTGAGAQRVNPETEQIYSIEELLKLVENIVTA